VPDTDADFDRLVSGVRSGDPEAMRAFYARYRPGLERVAARAIETGMRRRFGPESVAHSVCRTFLRRARGGEMDLPDADALWRLLCVAALNKVRELRRYHRRLRRSVSAEASGAAAEDALSRAPDAAPSADETAAFRDQLEHVLATLTEPERRVLDLRLAGLTQQEIADEVGCTERTVRRTLARLETRLTEGLGS
jgi:RNA polymerase sigma factor (sigma-70 family)